MKHVNYNYKDIILTVLLHNILKDARSWYMYQDK